MTIELDIVIDSNDDPVDMKAGLESMNGASDTVRCISDTILSEKTPKRQTSKSKVRTALKESFKGSYGHIFSLDIYDDELLKRYATIGKPAFIELITYFIRESLYQDSDPLSARAQKVVDRLGKEAEVLVSQLRVSSLKSIHAISTKFNHDIKLQSRQSSTSQTLIAKFDRSTAMALQTVQSSETLEISIVVTRLNIHTGNGRLQIKEANETVAFGFDVHYTAISLRAKKIFSENLNYNNGIPKDQWKYLRLSATSIRLRDGKIVKYIVNGIYEV